MNDRPERPANAAALVEVAQLDLRYEGCRLKSPAAEDRLLAAIAQGGIQEPLQGGAGSRAAIANIHQSCSDSHAIANPMDGVFGTDSGPHRAHAATS